MTANDDNTGKRQFRQDKPTRALKKLAIARTTLTCTTAPYACLRIFCPMFCEFWPRDAGLRGAWRAGAQTAAEGALRKDGTDMHSYKVRLHIPTHIHMTQKATSNSACTGHLFLDWTRLGLSRIAV